MPKKIKNKDLAQAKHIKFLDALTKQAVLGYHLIMNKMLEEIKDLLKKEKLVKSDKLPTGWTGEVPTIKIDFNEVLSNVINKYIKSMEWMMLGGYASKDAIKAAKDLGLTKIMIPGVAPSAYLNSIDSHMEHHKDLFGTKAPDLPENVIKIAFDQIKNRCVRVTEEFGLKLKNRIIDAIDQTVQEKNMKNLLDAHSEAVDNLLIQGGEEAVAGAVEDLDNKLGIRKITKAFKEVQEKLETDWERTVNTEASLSSAVGTHQSMLEIYGKDNDDVTVIIEGFYDDRICDFCYNISKNPDGSFKKYKMKDFKPSGYNFSRKKSEWELCIPKLHYGCRCQAIYIPKGFDVDKNGNFIPK
jgi:hypothetical protein